MLAALAPAPSRRGAGRQPRRFLGQRQERIALGAGKTLAAMFAPKKRHKSEDQPKAEEDRYWYD